MMAEPVLTIPRCRVPFDRAPRRSDCRLLSPRFVSLAITLLASACSPDTSAIDVDPRPLSHRTAALEVPAHHLDQPAFLFEAWPYPRSAEVDGRPLDIEPAFPGLLPIPPGARQIVITAPDDRPFRVARFGDARALLSHHFHLDAWQFVIGCVLFITGTVLLAGSLTRQHTTAMRGLALFALCIGLLSIGQSPAWSSLIVGPQVFWENVRFVSVYLFPVGLVIFVIGAFGDTRRGLLRWLSYGLLAYLAVSIAGVALLHIDSGSMRRFAYLFTLSMIGSTLVHVFAARHRDPAARLFLIGFASLFVFSVPDISWAIGMPLLPINGTPFGLFVFAICGTLILVQRASEQRVAAEIARTEVAARLAEVQTLNLELRSQVERRSREIKELLAGGMSNPGLADELAIGEAIDGRYTIVSKLGSGAMGSVYLVARVSDGRRLALKVLTGTVTSTEAARFAREAEIAARLHHPNLVGIVDIGLVSRRFVYLVMELVEGRTLEQAREQFGQLDFALPRLQQIAAGLTALHAAGFVHRDLKPTNVLLARGRDGGEEIARIADFGVAREAHTPDPVLASDATQPPKPGSHALKLTSTGAMVGTPLYMAPEGVRGQGAQPFDVYSFGLIAFELLAGRYPFTEAPAMSLLNGRGLQPVQWPTELAVPEPISRTVIDCLHEDPLKRPKAADVLAAFSR